MAEAKPNIPQGDDRSRGKPSPCFATALCIASAILMTAGACVYHRRSRERMVGHEGLDDPEIARAFNHIARMPHMRLLRLFAARRAVQLVRHGEAADLGCGPGYLVVDLARQASQLHITGIDLSPEMLREAETYTHRAGLNDRVSFKLGDVERIPFPDQSLDLVVSTLSLHHWGEPVPVLNEVARVLKPGGAFLIFDLRRDLGALSYLLIWFATRVIVPAPLRRINEPIGSRNAAYTLGEADELARQSKLASYRVTSGPLWLTIEGRC